jgi:Ala-tRNA(Pro) deacylase
MRPPRRPIALTDEREIAFNAGPHTELIRMACQNFEHLVKPKLVTA